MDLSARLTFENLLFVNYAVPPERLRPLVPAELVLDTIVGASGARLALVSAVTFRVSRAESPGGLALPLDAAQLNLRTYVRPAGRAVYFIRIELGVRPLGMLGEISLRGASPAPVGIATDYDEATGRYRAYEVRCYSPAGEIGLTVSQPEDAGSPPPGFASWGEAAAFVVERPIGFASSTIGGYVRLDVAHPPLRPAVGSLVQGRLRSLERLGVLDREEALRPHSVFIVRQAIFTVRPPRLILTPSGLRATT